MNQKTSFEKHLFNLSEKLNVLLARVPLKGRKWMLSVIGLSVGALCILMVTRPFKEVRIASDKIPLIMLVPKVQPLLSPNDRAFLGAFKSMMDSLKTHDPAAFARILSGREGLVDSVDLVLSIP